MGDREDGGKVDVRAAAGHVQVRRRADAELARAVHVTADTGALGDLRNGARRIQTTGLGDVNGDVVRRVLCHDVERVGRRPAALIGAHGHFEHARHLAQLIKALDRLLQILQIEAVHALAPLIASLAVG